MRNAMKKFVAVVLTLAMLLSMTTVAFATPIPVRLPNEPVSLYIHHVIGTLGQPVPNPGPWLPDSPTLGTHPPAVGSIWRAARVLAPPHFDFSDHVYISPPSPTSVDGASRLPWDIQEAIQRGFLGGVLPATATMPARRPVLTIIPGTPPTPGVPVPNWYITSDMGTTAPAIPGEDGFGPAIQGVLQARTGMNALPTTFTVAERARIAHFSPAMTQVRAPLTNGPDDLGDAGQGLWLVWEVPNTAPDADAFNDDVVVDGPGLPADRTFEVVVTPDYGIIPPYLVNLPHFRHLPPTIQDPPIPNPDYPGLWLYRVHVFPKQPAPTPQDKTLDDVEIGIGEVPGLGGSNVATEYATMNWSVTIGIPDDINTLPFVTPERLNQPGTPATPLTVMPGATPDLPAITPTVPAPTGAAAFSERPTILIQDTLDHRLALLAAAYGAASPALFALHGTSAGNNHTLGGDVANAPAGAVPTGNFGSWLEINTVIMDTSVNPPAFVSRTPFNRQQTVGTVTNALAWEARIGDTVPPAMLPYPNQTTPAGAGIAPNLGQQTFWINITQHGRNALAALPALAADQSRHIEVRFRTIMHDLTEIHDGAINNQANINFGNRPTNDVGGPDDPTSGTVIRNLEVTKVNPTDQVLAGAVFFMFRDDQIEYVNPVTNVAHPGPGAAPAGYIPVPRSGEEAERIAISGGLLGNTLGSFRDNETASPPGGGAAVALSATNPPTAFRGSDGTRDSAQSVREWGRVWANAAIPALAGTGIARFTNLVDTLPTPPANAWYLFEALAPHGGYRRVEGFERVVFPVVLCSNIGTDHSVGVPHDCNNPLHTCVYDHTHGFSFTNTRDFVLPLTGGAGTIMFTAAGVSLMGGAGLFLFLARKKEKTQR